MWYEQSVHLLEMDSIKKGGDSPGMRYRNNIKTVPCDILIASTVTPSLNVHFRRLQTLNLWSRPLQNLSPHLQSPNPILHSVVSQLQARDLSLTPVPQSTVLVISVHQTATQLFQSLNLCSQPLHTPVP